MNGRYKAAIGWLASGLAGVALFFTGSARGESSSKISPLTLPQLIDRALQNNPGLQAARAEQEAFAARQRKAGALPNPMFKYSGMDAADSSSFPDSNEKRFEVEQSFPWFGKRSGLSRIAAREADIMQCEYETKALETLSMVRETYYELCGADLALKVLHSENEVLHRMEKTSQARYQTGQTGQQDVLKAQAELTMLSQKILEFEGRRAAAAQKLNSILNRPSGMALDVEPGFPKLGDSLDVESALAAAEKMRPEIRAAVLKVEQQKTERALMQKEYFPDYTLGAEYRNLADQEDLLMFSVGVDLPLWLGKNRAGTRETGKMIETSENELTAVRNQVDWEVHDAHFRLKTARETLGLYDQKLIPQAQARFKASEAAYESGQADFLDLLESEQFLLNARLMKVMAEADYGVQWARLQRIVGSDLHDITSTQQGGQKHEPK